MDYIRPKSGAYDRYIKRNRKYLHKLQAGRCWYCENDTDPEYATAEHLVPIAKGGSPRSLFNIVMSCRSCNNGRRNHIPWEEWKLERMSEKNGKN